MSEIPKTASTARRAPAWYARLTALGFLLIALNALIILVIGAATGQLQDVSFNGVYLLVGLVVAGLSWRFRTWPLVVALVFALAVVASTAPRAIVSGEAVPVLLYLIGGLVALVAAILGLIDRVWHRG